jgi:hypothetical protein
MRFQRVRALVAAVCGVVFVSLIGAPGASADSTCGQNRACAWQSVNYGGSKLIWDTSAPYWNYGWLNTATWCCNSLKNHYGNRRVRFRQGSSGSVGCANPGEKRPDRNFNQVNIGDAYSRC